jgi:hypothetical protein
VLASVLAPVLGSVLGCGGGETIELVAIRGCGLDQEFSSLRVRVLGDFPPAGGSEILLGPGERGTIPALPGGATGIAAEGLFGTTVTAVGRSWGVDPALVAGRIAGYDEDSAILPIFFAAPDSLCELEEQPSAWSEQPLAAGRAGDLLLVGGVAEDGTLLDELVHVDLFTGETRALDVRLPEPRRGHSVHAIDSLDSGGARRFVVVGGARAGALHDRALVVDVAGSGELAPADEGLALCDHAAVRSPVDGRVLLAGGCDAVDGEARCDPASARAGALWLDPRDLDALDPLPDLAVPRFAADAAVGADGVAWVAGGFGSDGLGLASLERLRPGGQWSVVHELAGGQAIAGLALLDGGLALLVDDAGTVHWWSEAGSGSLDPTSRAPALGAMAGSRPMLALPGERVLVDTWLFAPATAAVDPAAERVQLLPDSRLAAVLVPLLDGTTILAGLRDPIAGELSPAPLWRLRPELDGPHEWIPELTGPQTDAFVTNAPGRARVILGGLRLDALGGEANALPPVRAHVRGFRSRAFRLEFAFEAELGATAHVVVGQGSEALVALALDTSEVVVRRRSAGGEVETLDCAGAGLAPGSTLVLEVGGDGRELRLDGPEGSLASCELDWPASAGLAVGFGVSGTGSARVFGLRLARR